MRLLAWLLGLFVPRETATDDTPAGDKPADDTTTPTDDSHPEARPDWLPEKFWDQDMGARLEPLAKAYNELEGKIRTKTDDLKAQILEDMKANAPENYEIKIEGVEIPEDIDLDLTPDDPLVNWFFSFAKERGMTQEDVSAAISEYIKIELENLPKMDDVLEALGDHGRDRMTRVTTALEQRLDDQEFKAISPLLQTAESVKALEKLLSKPTPTQFDGDGGSKPLSLQELRNMQNDPRYWRDKDPALIKRVEEGYARLYKNA